MGRIFGEALILLGIVIVLSAIGIKIYNNNVEQTNVVEQAQDCEDGGGYLIKSFRKKHEVWVCLTDFTEILVNEPSE